MTLQQVLNVVHSATQIKKWPNEYRVYSPNGFSLIYCDNSGNVTSFVTNLNGATYELTNIEKKQLQSAIDVQKHKLKSKYTCFDRTQKTK
ncbi:MAG: hypothetical protein UIC65_03870 [Alphaproteobacteria bacterium]|nr:hypothetical protein [Alphaproteobacteria bacterium]